MRREIKCADCRVHLGYLPVPGTTHISVGPRLPSDGLCDACRYHRRALAERQRLGGLSLRASHHNGIRGALFLAVAFILMLTGAAHAQNAVCPGYSMKAKVHKTTETSWTITVTEQCAKLVFQNTGAETVFLPAPGAHYPAGYMVFITELGAGGLTLTPTSPSTINGASTLAVAQNVACVLANDGTNWWC